MSNHNSHAHRHKTIFINCERPEWVCAWPRPVNESLVGFIDRGIATTVFFFFFFRCLACLFVYSVVTCPFGQPGHALDWAGEVCKVDPRAVILWRSQTHSQSHRHPFDRRGAAEVRQLGPMDGLRC